VSKATAASSSPSSTTSNVPTTSNILDGYLKRPECAQQLGKSSRTLDRWEVLGIGPPFIKMGRDRLYNVTEVRQWLAALAEKQRKTVRWSWHGVMPTELRQAQQRRKARASR
jgi:hypothetical protein